MTNSQATGGQWTVVVDSDHTAVVETTGEGKIRVEIRERRRGYLLRFGQRQALVAGPDAVEDLRRKLGAAIGVARHEASVGGRSS